MTSAEGRIRVLVVDDEPMVRTGLAAILETAADIEVVGSVEDGDEVLPLVSRQPVDVVLLDVRMKRQDGIATTGQLRGLADPPGILVLTTWDTDDMMFRAIEAGANGFLLKTAAPQDILDGVRRVRAGSGVVSPAKVPALFARAAHGAPVAVPDAWRRLSERERQVALALCGPQTLAEVAATMFLSVSTVRTHQESINRKLGISSRQELATIVARSGLHA